ncbi:HIPL1 protein-like isoform X1 [Pistacia vera]|uniref:HIPL1 protein-like isoform X1 n=1 Tax=Pistacia vera TaxID=55513 RepID=UPI001263C8E6|nr:HIPL1 protein-like isoform X1 [Pistacia vera]
MAACFSIFLLFFDLLLSFSFTSSLRLCTDLREPFTPKTLPTFCSHYNATGCCDSAKDLQLHKQFLEMHISDPVCASLMKSILCAACDQFSAELFKVESELVTRPVPVLCNSSKSVKSFLSNMEASSFCSLVWDACQNVSMSNSPFAASLQSSSVKLTELWHSESNFCNKYGGSSDDGSICFDGEKATLNKGENPFPPKGLCLEKIGNGSYLTMAAHPDGSNRAFFASQAGKIWLATIPEQGLGGILGIDESSPFIDLTEEVYFVNSFGMMGMAFHPSFAHNGRFFASFTCDKVKTPGCYGRCSCNLDERCDPSKLGSSDSTQSCRYHKVIAEFTANGTASELSLAKRAEPLEVRRIFSLGLPVAFNNGGQLLFGPADGYLYVMLGDGGIRGDPFSFSQNKKSLLGKILRLDVDNIPSETDIATLWGNYSVPQDNPFSEDKESRPEIWALGLRNPWRCSFDSQRPLYFICADAGQDEYEEVDIITKGGNYGWHVYEGPILFNSSNPFAGINNSANSRNLIFPVLGYKHSDLNSISASICGGYFYRSMTDPCLYGSYLYGDLYGSSIWAATENPPNSGNFTTRLVPFSCPHDSPIQCNFLAESSPPGLGYIYSFGEDNKKDIHVLASSGVYRVVRPSRCNFTCPKETMTIFSTQTSSSSSYRNGVTYTHKKLMLCFSSLLLFLEIILYGGV